MQKWSCPSGRRGTEASSYPPNSPKGTPGVPLSSPISLLSEVPLALILQPCIWYNGGGGRVGGESQRAPLTQCPPPPAPTTCVRSQCQRSKSGQERPGAGLGGASDAPHRMLLALKAHPGPRPNGLMGSAEPCAMGCVGVMTRLSAGDREAGDSAASVVAEGDATGTRWLGRCGGG